MNINDTYFDYDTNEQRNVWLTDNSSLIVDLFKDNRSDGGSSNISAGLEAAPLLTSLSFASIAVACGLLLSFCVFGNLLVVLAFVNEPTLRVITNYWIVSLSFTDIVLALTVMPLQMIKELNDDRWTFGALACDLFICMDVLCCTCSIYHLCLISLDRYFCVRFPIAYPQIRTKRATVSAIAITWIVCLLISLPRLFGWKDAQPDDFACVMNNKVYMVFSSVLSFYAPLFLICLTYFAIYKATHARTKRFARARFPITVSGSQQRFLQRSYTVEADEMTFVGGAPAIDANAVTMARSSDESSTGDGSTTPKKDRSVIFGRSNALARRFAQSMSLQALLAHSLTFDSFYAAANNNNNNNNNNDTNNESAICKENNLNRFRAPFFRMPSASDFNRRNVAQRAKLDRRRQKQEHRAAKVVVIVLAAFVLLWAPFFLVNIVGPLCGAACDISDDVWKVVTWLGYCNSAVNPAIYTFFNRTFRRAILDVCKNCRKICFFC